MSGIDQTPREVQILPMRERATRPVGNRQLAAIPIALLLLFPTPLTVAGLLGVVLIFIRRWRESGSPLPTLSANLPLLILLAMSGLALVISPAGAAGAVSAAQILAGVLVFFTLQDYVRSANELERVAAGVSIAAILVCLAAPFTVSWPLEKLFELPIYRIPLPQIGDSTNPNILAGTLAPILPIALAVAMRRQASARVLGLTAFVLIALTMLILQSRAAWFAAVIGLGVWATFQRRWVLPLVPLGLVLALGINYALGGPSPGLFFFGKVGTTASGTFAERQELWLQALAFIRQSPLVGIGLGDSVRYVVQGIHFNHAHNLYLQVAVEIGIIGAAAFVVLVGSGAGAAWRARASEAVKPLAFALIAAFVIITVNGLGDTVMWGAKGSIVMWILLGLAFASEKIAAGNA